jgi:hypothetical protein
LKGRIFMLRQEDQCQGKLNTPMKQTCTKLVV